MTTSVDGLPGPPDAARAALEEERDFLLAALRSLDAERSAGNLTDDDYRSLRDGYTARAATVLRLLGTAPPAEGAVAAACDAPAASDAVPPAAAAPPRSRRRIRVVVGVTGAALAVAGAGLMVAGAVGGRGPGQAITGSVPPSPGQELAAARVAMAKGDQIAAVRLYDAVLRVQPDQPEALAYRGWLLRLAGDADNNTALVAQGLASERAAVAAAPDYPDARFFLGVILLDDEHDPAGAVAQLEAYLADHPPAAVANVVQPILDRARSEAAGAH